MAPIQSKIVMAVQSSCVKSPVNDPRSTRSGNSNDVVNHPQRPSGEVNRATRLVIPRIHADLIVNNILGSRLALATMAHNNQPRPNYGYAVGTHLHAGEMRHVRVIFDLKGHDEFTDPEQDDAGDDCLRDFVTIAQLPTPENIAINAFPGATAGRQPSLFFGMMYNEDGEPMYPIVARLNCTSKGKLVGEDILDLSDTGLDRIHLGLEMATRAMWHMRCSSKSDARDKEASSDFRTQDMEHEHGKSEVNCSKSTRDKDVESTIEMTRGEIRRVKKKMSIARLTRTRSRIGKMKAS